MKGAGNLLKNLIANFSKLQRKQNFSKSRDLHFPLAIVEKTFINGECVYNV
jgi:hypothetical protein